MRVRRRSATLPDGAPPMKAQDMQDLYNMGLEVLGERIRRARQDKKTSQRDLSEGLFTSAYLSSLELGKTRPTPGTLAELARRLDKSIEYFLRPASGLLDNGRMADEDYLRVLRARQTLWLAQAAVERAKTQSLLGGSTNNEALPMLEESDRQSVRLSNTERGQYFYLLGRYIGLDPNATDRAIATLEESLRQLEQVALHDTRLSERLQTIEVNASVQTEMGDLYLGQGRIMQALSQFQTSLELLNPANFPLGEEVKDETNPDSNVTDKTSLDRLRWRLLARVARCYARLNDKEQTLTTMRQAVEIANGPTANSQAEPQSVVANSAPALPEINSLLSLTDSYFNQARLLTEHNDFQQASLKIGRSLQLFEQAQDGFELLDIYANLAELELNAGQYEWAENEVQQVLSWLNRKVPGYQSQKLKVLVTLAQVRSKQERADEAMSIIKEALDLLPADQSASSAGAGRLYQTAAEVQARLGHKDDSIKYYQKALAVLPTPGINGTAQPVSAEVADIYYSYGQQLREWGEVERAFELLEKAYQFRQGR